MAKRYWYSDEQVVDMLEFIDDENELLSLSDEDDVFEADV